MTQVIKSAQRMTKEYSKQKGTTQIPTKAREMHKLTPTSAMPFRYKAIIIPKRISPINRP
jgi:hypothetical protein